MADSRNVEVTVGSEISQQKPREISTVDKIELTAARGAVGTAKLTGKVAIGSSKFALRGAIGILDAGRKVVKNFGKPAVFATLPIIAGVAAAHPKESAGGAVGVIRNPEVAVRDIGSVSKNHLIEAVDVVISKAEKTSLGLIIEPLSEEELKTEVEKVIDIYSPGENGKDRQNLSSQILLMHEYMKGILTEESFMNIQNNWDLIESNCSQFDINPNVVVGLAMGESRGGVDAAIEDITAVGAVGPFQMTDEFVRAHGFEPTNDENDPRLKWEITVPIVVKELSSRRTYFGGNMDFAIWSWHRGVSAVEEDIYKYAELKGFDTSLTVDQLVRQFNITAFDLLGEAVIARELEHPGQDSTNLFLLRNEAGALIWINVIRLADRLNTSP